MCSSIFLDDHECFIFMLLLLMVHAGRVKRVEHSTEVIQLNIGLLMGRCHKVKILILNNMNDKYSLLSVSFVQRVFTLQ